MDATHHRREPVRLRAAALAVVACAALVDVAAAQSIDPPMAAEERPAASPPDQPASGPPTSDNPWGRRPVCASMFLKSDWQLTKKQRACDWLQNRLFSESAILGAAWSAGVSKVRDSESERGDGFGTRFGRRFAQSAFKSTATYLGAIVADEDPRMAPPYLAMSAAPRPRGFWRRTRHALAYNFVSYRCAGECRRSEDIERRPALSRVLGALASGYASEVWTWDRETSHQRALRGAATAYGSTFMSALFTEFKPEITGFASRTFGALFGFR
jgi:hypothetical protein